ncbi:hypothetical protein [Polaromonas glacialis]|uniref:hypothetical protein n=1 Tax=Polaromonas glacialis TaxID=866564 RepID=UPI0012EC0BA2|nr:hypothetical protein [Polaromonas glacialis]
MAKDEKESATIVFEIKRTTYRVHITHSDTVFSRTAVTTAKAFFNFARAVVTKFEEYQQVVFLTEKASKLEIAPGYRLHNFLSSICSKAFSERELDALHADSIELYYEKLKAGDEPGAVRVRYSMHVWMIWAVIGGAITGIFSMVRGKQKSSE